MKLTEIIKLGIDRFFWQISYAIIEGINGFSFVGFGIAIMVTPISNYVVKFSIAGWPQLNSVTLVAVGMILLGVLKVLALIYGSIKFRKWLCIFATGTWIASFVSLSSFPIKPASLAFIIVFTWFSFWASIRLIMRHRGERLIDPTDPYGRYN